MYDCHTRRYRWYKASQFLLLVVVSRGGIINPRADSVLTLLAHLYEMRVLDLFCNLMIDSVGGAHKLMDLVNTSQSAFRVRVSTMPKWKGREVF